MEAKPETESLKEKNREKGREGGRGGETASGRLGTASLG